MTSFEIIENMQKNYNSSKTHARKTITSKNGQIKLTTIQKNSFKLKTKINRSIWIQESVQRIQSKHKIQKETLKYIHSTSLQVGRQIFPLMSMYKSHIP